MKVVELSGGVGGARLARGFSAVDEVDLTVVVNVGDDLPTHGLYVAPDIDTVIYTLAGIEGPQGWGRADDTFVVNDELGRFGLDNSFRLGDRDLAMKIYRTRRLAEGASLSEVTAAARQVFGVSASVLPVSDDPIRTTVLTREGLTLTFQAYFVERGHRDHVTALSFEGAESATAAHGVVEAIDDADLFVIGPSNPPMSIWPILAVDEVGAAVRRHRQVAAVSPLIGGKTVKGPADAVMSDLGLGTGTPGVIAAYRDLIDVLVVDDTDASDSGEIDGVRVVARPTLMTDRDRARQLAEAILAL